MIIGFEQETEALNKKKARTSELDTMTAVLSRSPQATAIADSKLNIVWSSDEYFYKAKFYKNSRREIFLVDDCYYRPIDHIKTKLDNRVYYIIKKYDDDMLVRLFLSPLYERLHSDYRSKLEMRLSNYLDVVSNGGGSNIRSIKEKIMALNTDIKSDMENFEEFLRLTAVDLNTMFFSISEQMFDYFDSVKNIAHYNGYEFEYEIDRFIAADINPDRLKCALSNLIANGYKYNVREDKKMWVDIHTDNIYFYVDVYDNGAGFDEDVLEKTYTPFSDFGHRGSAGQPDNGEGLGIYLVRKLAEELDGKLTFKMKAEGFCATLSLRRVKDKERKRLQMIPKGKYITFFEPEYMILAKGLKLLPYQL